MKGSKSSHLEFAIFGTLNLEKQKILRNSRKQFCQELIELTEGTKRKLIGELEDFKQNHKNNNDISCLQTLGYCNIS